MIEEGRNKRKVKYKCHKRGKFWFVHEFQRSERVRSKQERLGRDEMRRHGKCRSECAGDRSSVIAREKSRDPVRNRIEETSIDSVRSFDDEKLQTNRKASTEMCHSGA